MTSQESVVLEHIDFFRESRDILSDINFTVRQGEHWALIGANGAGKSTLLKICGAETLPSRGMAYVLGSRLGRVDIRTLRELIGHVNPRHNVSQRLTPTQIVLTGATGTTELMNRWEPSSEQIERATQLISEFGLDSVKTHPWRTLSQGERTRTLVARALFPRPQLLLLDEPSTGLDIAAREQLLALVDNMHRSQPDLATILVTHHLEELPSTTTYAALLKAGVMLNQGDIASVLTSESVSECFDYPITVEHHKDRWTARGTG